MSDENATKVLKDFLSKISLTENKTTLYFLDTEESVNTTFKRFKIKASKAGLSKSELKEIFLEKIQMLKAERKRKEEYALQRFNDPLNENDKILWEPFRYSVPDGVGEPTFFLYVDKATSTFKRVCSPDHTTTLRSDEASDETLSGALYRFNLIKTDAERFFRNPPIGFSFDQKSKSKRWKITCPDDISQYWRKSLAEITLSKHNFLTEQPIPFSNDPTQPNLGFFDLNNMGNKDLATPNWDSWMTQFRPDQQQVLKAFFFSIFDAKNTHRQSLYLQSKGHQGKTFAINSIIKYIGRLNTGSISTDNLNSQFWASSIYDKRLIIWDDIKNPNVLKYEKIQKMLGQGLVSVEYKGKDPFTATINSKLLMSSNLAPNINVNAYEEKSRVIYIKANDYPIDTLKTICKLDSNGNIMKDGTGQPIFNPKGNFTEVLLEELPHFLAKCKESYLIACPEGQKIEISTEIESDMTINCQSTEEEDYQLILDNNYIITNSVDDLTPVKELNNSFKRHTGEKTVTRGFVNWLNSKLGDTISVWIEGKTQKCRQGIIHKSLYIPDNTIDVLTSEVEAI